MTGVFDPPPDTKKTNKLLECVEYRLQKSQQSLPDIFHFDGMYEVTNSVISETDSYLHISYIHFYRIAFDILSFLAEGTLWPDSPCVNTWMFLQVVLYQDQESEHQPSDEETRKTVRNVLEVKNKIKSVGYELCIDCIELTLLYFWTNILCLSECYVTTQLAQLTWGWPGNPKFNFHSLLLKFKIEPCFQIVSVNRIVT